jgi:signal transduction histidine kinase/integral membrane sensor domain MASE1
MHASIVTTGPVSDLAGRRRLAVLACLAIVSLVGNGAGSALRYPALGTAILFPPYAALTASLVVSPRTDWIWCIAVAVLAHVVTHWPAWPLSWVLVADLANVARAVTAALLLVRVLGRRPRIDSLEKLALFVLSAVIAAPAVGATIGAANVVAHGGSESYWRPWTAWFVSNGLTGLAMLPAFLSGAACLAGLSRPQLRPMRVVEAGLLLTALVFACALSLLSGLGRVYLALPLYGTLPVLIWAAVRFGPSGASVALTTVAFAAVWSVDRGTGPFLAEPPDDNVFALQLFTVCTAGPVMCLAAIASARESVLHLYRALLASLQDHVAVLDADGVVIAANSSWRRAARSPHASPVHAVAVGESYVSTCEAAARTGDKAAEDVLNGLTSVLARDRRRFEIEYDCRQETPFDAYAMSIETLARAEGGAVITRRSITARRQAQAEIEEQRNQLSHLTRVATLGHLSGALAHELNQPLTAILSNAEAGLNIIRGQPPDLELVGEILRDIAQDDHRAAAVIARMRALLKRGEVLHQQVDLKAVVDEVLVLARAELLAHRVAIASRVDPALPPVWGDKIQLEQVLLNLVVNACEAMSATALPQRRLLLTAERDGAHGIHITVRDSGVGVPPALLDGRFKPFMTTKANGLGPGLSISHTIIAAHGGRLWAENNPDLGATLHCTLPTER